MKDIRLKLPTLHPGQIEIAKTPARFRVTACGRRWGKSYLGVRAACHPLIDGQPVGWFAPNYKFLTEAWRDLRRILKPITSSVSKSEYRIETITGGVIEFWTLTNEDAGRSRKYKRVIIDEAGIVGNLEDSWNEAIRPTLTDLRGDAFMLGTPKGQNFFWKAFEWGQSRDDKYKEWASWQKPTITNTTIEHLPEEIEAARNGMPERSFQQEYEAIFLEDGGGVFRGVRAAVDTGRTENEGKRASVAYCVGVDIARVNDFTVITVVDSTGRQVYFERFNQISWERQIEAILRVAKQYGATVIIDSTGVGDPIFEAVRRAGVRAAGYHLTNASKEAAIDNLAMAIENSRLRLMDIPTQTAELLAYQYELTPSRNVRMNAPQGMHDDTVIALALAQWGATHKEPNLGYRATDVLLGAKYTK